MRNMILTLNGSGHPHSWMTWQDAVTLKCKGLVAWEFGDEDFMFRGGVSRITGKRSHVEVGSIIALKSKFHYEDRVPALNNKNLFRRDLNLCGYCGKTFRESQLTKDHIVPVSRGGLNTWTNCITACMRCNNIKGNMSLADCGMDLLYVPYVPDKTEGLILQNRNILIDQMNFLVNFLPKHSRIKKMI